MTTLADTINNTREFTISSNYNAAVNELKHLIEKNPFAVTFTITAGCISIEMTNEIAKRFNSGNVKAIVTPQSLVSKGFSILVTCPLSSYLTNINDN